MGLNLKHEGSLALATRPVEFVASRSRRREPRQKIPDTIPRGDIRLVPPEVQRLGLEAFEINGE